jgi:ESCRT-I complex subunit VPS37
MEGIRKGAEGGLPGLHSYTQTLNLSLTRSPHAQRFAPQFLLMRLRHSTTAQDDVSEALASSFVNSIAGDEGGTGGNGTGREVDEFVREFRKLRKVYHKRVMWGDRWAAGQVEWRND